MSTPINPSNIMIYKIIKDYENNGRKVHLLAELDFFSNRVLEFANSITDKDFWVLKTTEFDEELSKICDITSSFCELNEQKYNNGGKEFAKRKIGQMPYSLLKGAVIALREYKEMKTSSNTTTSIIHNQDGTKQVSTIYWDKGPIVIDNEDTLIK
jgi:hypothetical protein